MAVQPLFNASTAIVQGGLRLTGLKASSDGESIFLRGMSAARVSLYQRLGTAIVTEMLAIAEVDNPTTLDQLRRKACSLVETEMTRSEVMRTMPVMVADASGDKDQLYNDEGVWRGIDSDELDVLLRRISNGIEELLELILNENDLGEDTTIHVWDGSRSDDADEVRFPGGTLWPTIAKFTGNFGQSFIYGSTVVPVRFQLPE